MEGRLLDDALDFGYLRSRCEEYLKALNESSQLTDSKEACLTDLVNSLIAYVRTYGDGDYDMNELIQNFFGRLFGPEPLPEQVGLKRSVMRRFRAKVARQADGRQLSLDVFVT
jgi:hypothetical protein